MTDDLVPSLGPLSAAAFALELAASELPGSATNPGVWWRLDGTDADVVAVIVAQARLSALLLELAAHGLPVGPGLAQPQPVDYLTVIAAHQHMRADIEALDRGELP